MKIGFIDYYLDEWHANNYPQWIQEVSNGRHKVCYGYALIDSPRNGMTTAQWCKEYGVEQCTTIEEIIDKSDVLVVLSPDNCEMHEQLSQLPLRSGKPTYIDKTFAPDAATAKRIFAVAEQYGTPCYSTSALRYASEYEDVNTATVKAINCWGGGNFEIYSIHQLEPLMMLMKAPAKRVMYLPGERWLTLTIEFEDGRYGTISQFEDGSPFVTNVCCSHGNKLLTIQSNFFNTFIRQLVDFFETGVVKVEHEETITIMAVREAGMKAQKCPGEWVKV